MNSLLATLATFAMSASAFATNVLPPHSAPEIDGALTIQVAALAGGLALLLKKKKKFDG